MVRAQVQLTEQQIQSLRRLATQKKKSIAELVRQSVELYLTHQATTGKALQVQRALALSGKFSSKTKDGSTNHDKYLADAFLE